MDIREIKLPQTVTIKQDDNGRLSFRFKGCPTIVFIDRRFATARKGHAVIMEITDIPRDYRHYAFVNGYMEEDGIKTFVPSIYPPPIVEATCDPELPALAELRYTKNEPGLILTFPQFPRQRFYPSPSWKGLGEGPAVIRTIYTGEDGKRYVTGERVPIIAISPKAYLMALIKTSEAAMMDRLYIYKVRHPIFGELHAQSEANVWGQGPASYILAHDNPEEDSARVYATLEMSSRTINRCTPVAAPQKATDIILGDAAQRLTKKMNEANPAFIRKHPRAMLQWEEYESQTNDYPAPIWDAIQDGILRTVRPVRTSGNPILGPTGKPLSYMTMDPNSLFKLCNYSDEETEQIFAEMRRANEDADAVLENYLLGGVIALA